MPNFPKVSICIPAYNHAQFLPAAIDSALAQTYPNVEIVIVDDGSNDDTLQISENYAAKHSAISVLTHPGHQNRGISATINLALRTSTGDYWSLLGSDDAYYPQKTKEQVEILQRNPNLGWVYSYANYIDREGTVLAGLFGEDLSSERYPIEKQIIANRVPDMSAVVRRRCLDDVGEHLETVLYNDWEFWVRMMARHRMAFINRPLVQYRVHGSNTSFNIDNNTNSERALEVMNAIQQRAIDSDGVLSTARIRALVDLQKARYFFFVNQIEAAKKSLQSVFELYPSIENQPAVFVGWLTSTYLGHLHSSSFYEWLTQNLPANIKNTFRSKVEKSFKARVLARAATNSYKSGDLEAARSFAVKAQATDYKLIRDRELMSILVKSLAGSRVMNKAKQVKHRSRLSEGK